MVGPQIEKSVLKVIQFVGRLLENSEKSDAPTWFVDWFVLMGNHPVYPNIKLSCYLLDMEKMVHLLYDLKAVFS